MHLLYAEYALRFFALRPELAWPDVCSFGTAHSGVLTDDQEGTGLLVSHGPFGCGLGGLKPKN